MQSENYFFYNIIVLKTLNLSSMLEQISNKYQDI